MTLTRSQLASLSALRGMSETFKIEQGYYNGTDGVFVLGDNEKAWFVTTSGATHRLKDFPPPRSLMGEARG